MLLSTGSEIGPIRFFTIVIAAVAYFIKLLSVLAMSSSWELLLSPYAAVPPLT